MPSDRWRSGLSSSVSSRQRAVGPRVLAGQAGNPWTFGQRLKYIQAVGQTVDAVASTNYYNGYATLEYIKRKMFDGSTPEGWVKALRDDLAGGIARWGDQFSGSGSNGGLIQYTQGKIPIITYEGGLNTDVVSQREFGAPWSAPKAAAVWTTGSRPRSPLPDDPKCYELTQQYCDRERGWGHTRAFTCSANSRPAAVGGSMDAGRLQYLEAAERLPPQR